MSKASALFAEVYAEAEKEVLRKYGINQRSQKRPCDDLEINALMNQIISDHNRKFND